MKKKTTRIMTKNLPQRKKFTLFLLSVKLFFKWLKPYVKCHEHNTHTHANNDNVTDSGTTMITTFFSYQNRF